MNLNICSGKSYFQCLYTRLLRCQYTLTLVFIFRSNFIKGYFYDLTEDLQSNGNTSFTFTYKRFPTDLIEYKDHQI